MDNKNQSPLISIAVCTYNGEQFLREQMNSLVYQDYSNLEIIVVDDCSTDQTLEILKDYSDKFPFVKIYQNETNIGYVKNFEKSISKCSGEYIALSDQDDIWELHKITTLFNNINDNILIYHDSNLINENGEPLNIRLSDLINLYEGNDYRPFLLMNCISGHSMLFKKGLLRWLSPFSDSSSFAGSAFHDWWIAFTAANYGSIGLIHENLVHYRQHNNTETDITKRRAKEKRKRKVSDNQLIAKQLVKCKNYAKPENYFFIDRFHQLMTKRIQSDGFSFSLFLFLVKNIESLLFIRNRNFLSNINFMRKINRY